MPMTQELTRPERVPEHWENGSGFGDSDARASQGNWDLPMPASQTMQPKRNVDMESQGYDVESSQPRGGITREQRETLEKNKCLLGDRADFNLIDAFRIFDDNATGSVSSKQV